MFLNKTTTKITWTQPNLVAKKERKDSAEEPSKHGSKKSASAPVTEGF